MSSCRWLSRNLRFCRTGLCAAASLWAAVLCGGAAFAADQVVPNAPAAGAVEPITFRVVAVNPSSTKTQQVPEAVREFPMNLPCRDTTPT